MKRDTLAVVAAALWIVASEFVRNEFLLKNHWVEHYDALGLEFETLPINGLIWTVWSVALSILLYMLMKKFTFAQTLVIAWIFAFFMMWLTAYNLQVLPLGLLVFAVPMSLIELAVALAILQRISRVD